LVAGVFLFTVIAAPLQAVFACDLMDSQTSRTCCCDDQNGGGCPMGGSCDWSGVTAESNCCQISFSGSSSAAATSASHHSYTLAPADDPQPRLPLSAATEPPLFNTPPQWANPTPAVPDWHRGTRTYLVTLRLRD